MPKVKTFGTPPQSFATPGPTVADMTGDTFGFLKVVGYHGFDMKRVAAIWWVQCMNCNRYKKCARTSLMFGRTKSCGGKGCKSAAIEKFGVSALNQTNEKTRVRRSAWIERKRLEREAMLNLQMARAEEKAKALATQAAYANRPRRAIDTPERWFTPKYPRDKNGHVKEVGYSPYRITCQGDRHQPFIDPTTALWARQDACNFGREDIEPITD